MKLKTVTVEFEFVIAVEDDDQAESVAREHVIEAIRDIGAYDLDLFISAYKPGTVAGWDGECYPYGGDGNTRTKDYG